MIKKSVGLGHLKKWFRRGIKLALVSGCLLWMMNTYVVKKYEEKVIDPEVLSYVHADCVMVLGAGVWSDNSPSPMLVDRLVTGIDLYERGYANRLLMSGDHGRKEYDEVNVMKDFAIDRGVKPDHIFMDHAGFSTYESMVRAQKVFQVERMIIVTQGYHLYRALYIANRLGIDAYGVSADLRPYKGQTYRDIREVAARLKDVVYVLTKQPPTYLGDVIPIGGSGSLTDDER